MLMPIGALTMLVTLALNLPEPTAKPPPFQVVKTSASTLDPVGFLLLAAATVTLLFAITCGGGKWAWSSPTIIGLLCGIVGLAAVFGLWTWRQGDAALIPPACLRYRTVYAGGAVMFLQDGMTRLIPCYLPFWFQAVWGDGAIESAAHMLSSLVSNLIALILFGGAVRRLHYIPPGPSSVAHCRVLVRHCSPRFSLIPRRANGTVIRSSRRSGRGWRSRWFVEHSCLLTPHLWLTCVPFLQQPTIAVQEHIPASDSAMALSVVGVAMQLGIALGVSAALTIVRNEVPLLLKRYAPDVDASSVINAGATEIRNLVPKSQLEGFLTAYNQAVTTTFVSLRLLGLHFA